MIKFAGQILDTTTFRVQPGWLLYGSLILSSCEALSNFSFRVCFHRGRAERFSYSGVHNDSGKRHLRVEELDWKIKHRTAIIPK